MQKIYSVLTVALMATSISRARSEATPAKATPDWSLKATIIEACSCPQLCQCYFNTVPASHAGHDHGGGGETYCRFNNAFQVEKGNYGKVKLDGAKFWIAGDLGHDLSLLNFEWAVLTFDSAVTEEQKEGIREAVKHMYPVKWGSFTEGKSASIEWKGGKDRAEARMDGGKGGEVILNVTKGMNDEPVVVKNLKYWGVPRNEGFKLMGNEVEAYRVGEKAFEFKGTTGFMLSFDINSNDAKKESGMSGMSSSKKK